MILSGMTGLKCRIADRSFIHTSASGGLMPRITLTDFIEVVTKTAGPKATKVSQLKNRQAYDPATDFYKAFREGLIALHKRGGAKS
jgi:hypothetical protein